MTFCATEEQIKSMAALGADVAEMKKIWKQMLADHCDLAVSPPVSCLDFLNRYAGIGKKECLDYIRRGESSILHSASTTLYFWFHATRIPA